MEGGGVREQLAGGMWQSSLDHSRELLCQLTVPGFVAAKGREGGREEEGEVWKRPI